ncbi:MAG: hypothetical protein M3P12_12190 [Gemmatimonadota bacterium]|nr:hypothetical protein [Gemmatimonadota bacterium]
MTAIAGRFSPALRIWILVAAFAQAIMPGVASIVDASSGAASASVVVRPHIESHGSPKCPRVHQEDKCALCQFVSGVLAPSAEPAPLSLQQSSTLRVIGTRPQSPKWLTQGAPSLPRAPPIQA